jgi:hypothetical protein
VPPAIAVIASAAVAPASVAACAALPLASIAGYGAAAHTPVALSLAAVGVALVALGLAAVAVALTALSLAAVAVALVALTLAAIAVALTAVLLAEVRWAVVAEFSSRFPAGPLARFPPSRPSRPLPLAWLPEPLLSPVVLSASREPAASDVEPARSVLGADVVGIGGAAGCGEGAAGNEMAGTTNGVEGGGTRLGAGGVVAVGVVAPELPVMDREPVGRLAPPTGRRRITGAASGAAAPAPVVAPGSRTEGVAVRLCPGCGGGGAGRSRLLPSVHDPTDGQTSNPNPLPRSSSPTTSTGVIPAAPAAESINRRIGIPRGTSAVCGTT